MMQKPILYLSNHFLDRLIPRLDHQWQVMNCTSNPIHHDVTAMATTVWDDINPEFLCRFPKLKMIAHLGIGVDNIDTDYIKEQNIQLLSQQDAGIHDTAELAISFMLMLTRNLALNDAYVRGGHWLQNKPRHQGRHVYGKNLGLVGFGKIGQTIAKFAHALGMTIHYTATSKKDNDFLYHNDVTELATYSDYLIVCCPGGEKTHHLINANVLLALGEQGYLINVARGSVVDENALIQALQTHQIAGAGLDVFAQEPYVPEELLCMPNVVLSPHMGSSTHENLDSMFALQAQQLKDFLNHQNKDVS